MEKRFHRLYDTTSREIPQLGSRTHDNTHTTTCVRFTFRGLLFGYGCPRWLSKNSHVFSTCVVGNCTVIYLDPPPNVIELCVSVAGCCQ